LTIRSVTVSPYAAALSVLTEDERDLGVTLIDLGAGITSAAIFRDNTLVHVDAMAHVCMVPMTKPRWFHALQLRRRTSYIMLNDPWLRISFGPGSRRRWNYCENAYSRLA